LYADGRLGIFVRGTDNALYYASQLAPGGDWSAWANLGGSFAQSPVVVRAADGHLEIFVHDIDGSLTFIRQTRVVDGPFHIYLPMLANSGRAQRAGSAYA